MSHFEDNEEPEELLCNSCGEWKMEDEMVTGRLCEECKADQDQEYENSFRNAFNS